jgi:uncharacterized protein (TIGR02569 family)
MNPERRLPWGVSTPESPGYCHTLRPTTQDQCRHEASQTHDVLAERSVLLVTPRTHIARSEAVESDHGHRHPNMWDVDVHHFDVLRCGDAESDSCDSLLWDGYANAGGQLLASLAQARRVMLTAMLSNNEAAQPPIEVQRGFGRVGPAERYVSGEAAAFRVADAVFKPVVDRLEAEWIGGVLENLVENNFRVAKPIRAADGGWVVDGWTAYEWVEGQATTRRWDEIATAGSQFHRSLRGIAKPTFVDTRTHQWAIGDRVAFGEQEIAIPTLIAEQVADLRACIAENRLPSQVIHGDLTGNVLLADGLPPAIIDFSPYYRPVGYATAVIVVDAIAWFGASFALTEVIEPAERRHDLLARALIFRLVAAALNPAADDGRLQLQARAHAHLAAFAVDQLRRQ